MKRLPLVGLLVALWCLLGAATWLQFQSLPADGSPGMTVTGLLRVPEGEGLFPAAILLADCDGITPHERRWGRRFVAAGYVTYLLDSFFTRNVSTACDGAARVPVMDDLNGALAKLATLPQVDMSRVVVVGWQSGADVALEWAAVEGPGVAVAFYPSCAERPGLQRPALFVLPELYDDNRICNAYAADLHDAAVVPVQRIAPFGVGAGFECEECLDGYLGGPGGWNEPADGLVLDNLFGEIAHLLDGGS